MGMPFPWLRGGHTPQEVAVEQLDLTETAAQKFYAAYVLCLPESAPLYFDIAKSNALPDLVDECITHRVVPSLASHFGRVNHVKYLELGGTKDKELYAYAEREGYRTIFSHDRNKGKGSDDPLESNHLTVCAIARAIEIMTDYEGEGRVPWEAPDLLELPVVVRFMGVNNDSHEIWGAIKGSKDLIDSAIEAPSTPYITVTKSTMTPGPSYKDIYENYYGLKQVVPPPEVTQLEALRERIKRQMLESRGGEPRDEKDAKFLHRAASKAAHRLTFGVA